MPVHPRRPGGGNVLGEGVGRHGQDGHRGGIRPGEGTDLPGGAAAVQIGHLHVHEDGVEGIGQRGREDLHRLPAVPGLGDLHAIHGQQLGGDLHVHRVVLGQEDVLPLQGDRLRHPLVRGRHSRAAHRLEGQVQGKGGPRSQGALHLDLAAHLGDQALDDGHAQARAHHLAGAEPGLPGVGLKDLGQKLLGHAQAGVPDHDPVLGPALEVQLAHLHTDAVPPLGELEGVGEEIVHDLAEPEGIPQHHRALQPAGHPEVLALLPGLDPEGGGTVLDAVLQVELAVVQHHLSLLQPGHVQDVVDEAQELPAGDGDLLQVVPDLLRLLHMLFGHLGEADDAVERSAHVVRHVAEKGLLGLFALAGGGQGILQQLPLLQLAALFLLHLPEAEHPLPLGQDLVKEDLHVHPAVLLAEASEEVAAELPHPLDGELLEAGGGEAVQIFLAGVLLDDLAHHPCQVLVPAGRGQALHDVIRSLDDLIGVSEGVHPIEGVTGVAQHRRRLVDPLHPGAEAELPPGEEAYAQQAEEKDEAEDGRGLPQLPEDGVIGHRDQGGPAVGHGAVINAALAAVQVHDVGVIGLRLSQADLAQEVARIVLQLGPGDV